MEVMYVPVGVPVGVGVKVCVGVGVVVGDGVMVAVGVLVGVCVRFCAHLGHSASLTVQRFCQDG